MTGRPRLRDLLLAADAAVTLCAASAAVKLLPFRTASRLFGLSPGAAATASAAPAELLDRIDWVIRAVGRRLPWESTCLMQAIAAAALLRRRNAASEVSLGVAKVAKVADGDGFAAHAWLTCGDRIVTGAELRPAYTAVATYHSRNRSAPMGRSR